MTTILITGAVGFIGSHLVEALSSNVSDTIIGVDNLDPYYTIQKKENLNLLKKIPNFIFIKGDLLDNDVVEGIFTKYKPSIVLHFAARPGVRDSYKPDSRHTLLNVEVTRLLALAAKKYQVQKFIFASSSSVYGDRRGEVRSFKETDILNPISPYAKSKHDAEIALADTLADCSLTVSILRLFSVYGERMRPDLAPSIFTEAILHDKPIRRFGTGEVLRDYTYIGDVIQGVRCVIQQEHTGFMTYNIGNGHPISINTMISTIECVTGKRADVQEFPPHQGDSAYTFADIAIAQSIGYRPSTDFETGMRRFIEWYALHNQ